MIMTSMTRWAVAPEGVSAASCHNCDTPYMLDQEHALTRRSAECLNCNARGESSFCNIALRADSAKFRDVDTVRDAMWYHATTRKHWIEDLLYSETISKNSDREINSIVPESDMDNTTPMVHIGTMEAAMTRAIDISRMEPEIEVFMYEIRLVDGARIADEIVEDDNDECPVYAGHCNEWDGYSTQVTRYVNRYESIGSVSLLVNPHYMEIVSQTTI